MDQSLPLMREAILEPFLIAAHTIGSPVESLLKKSGLPCSLAGDSPLVLLEPLAWRFIQTVSVKEGIKNFGLMAATSVSHLDIPSVRFLIADCANLFQLLQRFPAIARMFSNTTIYALEDMGDSVRYSHRGMRHLDNDMQVQQYQVLGMILLIRQATGLDWQPEDIYFTFPASTNIQQAQELQSSRLHFEQAYPAISIAKKMLQAPVTVAASKAIQNIARREAITDLPLSFSSSLKTIIGPYIGHQKVSKKRVASLAGISLRTLQRRLAVEQSSYTKILSDVRMQKATGLLKDRNIKILDITLALGYENASTFSRAFRSWTGLSPLEYRQLCHTNARSLS